MINHRKTFFRMMVVPLAVGAPAGAARAQAGGAGPDGGAPSVGQPPGTPPSPPASGTLIEAPPPDEGGEGTNLVVPNPAPPPGAPPAAPAAGTAAAVVAPAPPPSKKKRRVKPLQTTVGLQPTAPDFGAEADLVSTADEDTANVKPKKWTYSLRGFLRAPLRIGLGPNLATGDMSDGQLHSPPHVVGANNNDWNSVGLSPSPTASLYLSVGNALVTGTLIIASGTFFDAGYKELDQMGGISQAYVTMKFSDLFGERGGLAWTVGAFS